MNARRCSSQLSTGIRIIIVAVTILLMLFCTWTIGYHMRRSNDNLPTLQMTTELSTKDAENLISGYRRVQLETVWGKPTIADDKKDIWESDEGRAVIVQYDNNNLARIIDVRCALPEMYSRNPCCILSCF